MDDPVMRDNLEFADELMTVRPVAVQAQNRVFSAEELDKLINELGEMSSVHNDFSDEQDGAVQEVLQEFRIRLGLAETKVATQLPLLTPPTVRRNDGELHD